MKKSISLLFALACMFSLSAKTIYLNTGGSGLWGQASPEFFIHAWGAGDTDVHMTAVNNDPLTYQAEVPDGTTQCIFTRQKTGTTTIAWNGNDGLWNKTGDLTIGTNNCFTITGWGEGQGANSVGTWSTYTAPVETPTYYITGNDKLVGADKAWNEKAIQLGKATADAPATYTFTNLAAGDTMRLKVTNGTWNLHFGYTDLDNTCSSENIQTDKDGNIVFVLTAKGDVKLTFNGTNICLTGSFASPTPVQNITAYYVNTTNWEKVYAYVFEGANWKAAFPGEAMTKTADQKNGFDVYSYEFADTFTHIIFNNGNGGEGNQTADLNFDKTKPYFYDGIWYATLEEIPVPCTPDYGVMLGEEYTAATVNPENAAEYMVLNLNLKKGDTFTMYNNCAQQAWVIENIKEGSTENITIADGKYLVGETGKYDIYFTLAPDAIYIGYTATTPTEVVNAGTPDANAPVYNLLGVQVDGNYRGIVLQNGKKFIQK